MARSGRYYSNPFMVIIGVMQGDPLTHTIFNIVLDVVIPLWDTLVTVEASVLEGLGRVFQTLYAFFYIDDMLLDSQSPSRLQASLEVLMGLFDHVGIQTKFVTIVGMTCVPCLISQSLLKVSYTRRMNRVGPYTWAMNLCMVQTLEELHHYATRRLTRNLPWRCMDEVWYMHCWNIL